MNKIRLTFPALIFLFLNCAIGQTLIPKKCYMHLNGTIGRDFQIRMNLVKINDTLYGDYYFLLKGKLPEGKAYQDGSMIQLAGKMAPNGTFVLKEYPEQKGKGFTGHFQNGNAITGTWEGSDGTMKESFGLSENYPAGSVPMNVYYLKGSMPLVKKPKSPCATLQYSMLLPGESANPVFSDSIKKLVLQKFADRPVRLGDPEKVLLGMEQVYFENYITSNEAIYNKIQGMSFNWESVKTMGVLLNENDLMSFYIESYAFTGGAHGLQTRDYYVINLQNGKLIGLNDIFAGDYEEELITILNKKLRLTENIPMGQKLTESGFFVDEIKPTQNLYITRNGIGFFYNHYEIAPYSNGPTDIFVPFSEIRKILKQGSMLKGVLD